MAEPNRRIVIGFQQGGALPMKLSEQALATLHAALREGRERWHEIEGPDGAVLLDLGQVAYVRVESDEHRVGF